MSLFYVIKRLVLSIVLIVIAAAILLFSDLSNRETVQPETQMGLSSAPEPGRIYKIGIAYFAPEEGVDNILSGLFDGLRIYGFEKGKNLDVELRHGNGEIAMFPSILQTLDNMDLDLIITLSTPMLTAACNTIKNKQTVFTYCYDPIAAGAGKSFDDHLPMITGVGSFPPVEKTVDFLKLLVPGIKSVGTVYNSSEANSRKVMSVARDIFAINNIKLEELTVTNSNEVVQAVQGIIGKNVQAIWITGDNTAIQAMEGIARLAEKHKLPLITNDPEYNEKGAVAAVGIGWRETGFKTSEFVAKVLLGEKTKALPIINYAMEKVVLNHKQAERIGVNFPPEILKMEEGSLSFKPAKDKQYKIAFAFINPHQALDETFSGVIKQLAEWGFAEGKNLAVTYQHTSGDMSAIPTMLQNLDNQNYDLIIAATTPILTAACKSVKRTPVVFTLVTDPISAGAGVSFEEHHRNITGVATYPPVYETIEFIRKTLPNIKTIGTIYNSSEANSRKVVFDARSACREFGLKLEEATVTNTNEVLQAAEALAGKKIGVYYIHGDNTVVQALEAINKIAQKNNIPIVLNESEDLAENTIAAFGSGWENIGGFTAEYAARVLTGQKTKDIPIENYDDPKLYLNYSAAAKFKIAIPEEYKKVAVSKPTLKFSKKLNLLIMEYVESPNSDECLRGVKDGLASAGLTENKDFSLTIRNAQGDIATLSNMVDAAVSGKYDLIFVMSTPTLQSAVKKIKHTPIVFTNSADPVAAGAGKSFTDHASNITGISTMSDFDGMVRLVKKLSPKARRIGTLFTPAEINSVIYKDRLAEAAKKAGIEVVATAVYTSSDVPNAAQVLCSQNIDLLCQISDNLNNSAFSSIAAAAKKSKKLLLTFTTNEAKKDFALGGVARDYYVCGQDAAALGIRILQGENPKNIPFSYARKTVTIINKKYAKALGIALPAEVLSNADIIIEE